MSRELLKSILETKHPLYEKWLPIWERNETGLYGGDSTIDEFLVPFHWEKRAAAKGNDNSHFDERKKTAVYINFPAAVEKKLTFLFLLLREMRKRLITFLLI